MISKLTAVDTINDIFNFNFDVAVKIMSLVQKKFGETMEKFLKSIDYSDKYCQYMIGGKKGKQPFSLIFMPQNPVFIRKPPLHRVLLTIIEIF
jgi:hypothetical protein